MSSSGHHGSRKGKEVATASRNGVGSQGRRSKDGNIVKGRDKLASYTTHLVFYFLGEWLVVSDGRLSRLELNNGFILGKLLPATDLAEKYEYVMGQRILILWSGEKRTCDKVLKILRERFSLASLVAKKPTDIDLKAVADEVDKDFDGHYFEEYFIIIDSMDKNATGCVTMTPRTGGAGWVVENAEPGLIGIGSGSLIAMNSFQKRTKGLCVGDLRTAVGFMKLALSDACKSDPATGGNFTRNLSKATGGWDWSQLY